MIRTNKAEIKKPSWFDLDKYRLSAKEENTQWLLNLEKRVVILHYLNEGTLPEFYLSEIEKFWKEGFVIYPHPVNNHNADQKYVKTMNVRDIGLLYEFIPIQTKNDINKYINGDGYITDAMKQKVSALELLEENDLAYAKISLNAPLDEIEESFKQWIRKKKKKFNESIGFKLTVDVDDTKKADWFNYRLLPYMDLLIWMKLDEDIDESKKGILTTVATWIFDDLDRVKAEARLRRTTQKHLDDIMKFEFFQHNMR